MNNVLHRSSEAVKWGRSCSRIIASSTTRASFLRVMYRISWWVLIIQQCFKSYKLSRLHLDYHLHKWRGRIQQKQNIKKFTFFYIITFAVDNLIFIYDCAMCMHATKLTSPGGDVSSMPSLKPVAVPTRKKQDLSVTPTV